MGEARSALLIGIGRYDNSADLKSLDGPRVDVQNMRAVLEDPTVGAYRVETLEDVDSNTARNHLEDFLGNRSENETCLLYFSGHGFIDPTGALYLCTTNASFRRPESSTIPAYLISRLVDKCQSKRVVLVLDCCYAGNFSGFAKSANVVQPQFGGTGLGRVVLTAGAENQLAWDNGDKGSTFSRHIVEGLRSGAADTDGDGRITVQELYDYVYRKVVSERPGQLPGKNTYRENGPSFLIAESRTKRIEQIPAWLHHELGSSVAETRLNALKGLEELCLTRPNTRELVLERLRGAAAEDDSVRVQRLAQEMLFRLKDGGPATPPMPPIAQVPASIETSPSHPEPPARSRYEEVSEPPPATDDLPLSREGAIWAGWSLVGSFTCLVLLPTFGIVFYTFAPYLGVSLLLGIYLSYLTVHYRVVPSIAALFKSPAWWLGAIGVCGAPLLAIVMRRYDLAGLLVFACASLVAYTFLLKLSLRLRARAAFGLGALTTVVCFLVFGTVPQWGLDAAATRFASFALALPLPFLFGALARNRSLKAHGR